MPAGSKIVMGEQAFIAAESPMSESVKQFLQMIHENKVCAVVVLNGQEDAKTEGNLPPFECTYF